jgi:hypothetical protein
MVSLVQYKHRLDTKIATTDSASNDYITYTRITANVNAVQGNLTSSMTQMTANVNLVQDNVTAITGGVVTSCAIY